MGIRKPVGPVTAWSLLLPPRERDLLDIFAKQRAPYGEALGRDFPVIPLALHVSLSFQVSERFFNLRDRYLHAASELSANLLNGVAIRLPK